MVPKIRKGYLSVFPIHWKVFRMDEILDRIKNKVEVVNEKSYKQIGVRSHGKGIFYKEPVTGEELGNKSVFWVEPNCFVVNIVFAWEMAVAKTIASDAGLIASHRFPMYKPKSTLLDLDFLLYYFKMPLGKHLLGLASPGGAGRNKTLGQKEFAELEICIPPVDEQQEIVSVLSPWEKTISLKQRLIEEKELQNKGLMQLLLTGEKRINGFNENWQEKNFGEYFVQRSETNYSHLQLLSVGINGVYPQNRSDKKDNSNSDKSKYKRICIGDIGYNTMRMWQGRSALSNREGIVSPAYTIVTPKKNADSTFFSYLFKLPYVVNRFYRNSQGMVSDTWQCRYKDFSSVKAFCPPTIEEQKAIAAILLNAEKEISLLRKELKETIEIKRGLMQQLLTGSLKAIKI